MKKLAVFALVMVLALSTFGTAFAGGNNNGMPSAHGLDGKDFGEVVSTAAQSSPGAIAAHVSSSGDGGGMPAAHGLSGAEFGAAVSGLAQSSPGAVAGHVSGK